MELIGMDSKLRANVETKSVDSPDFAYEGGLRPQKGSTQNDVLDMSRMGKRQELQGRWLQWRLLLEGNVSKVAYSI
ncbi:MAG: hypothetical protein Q9207_002816 [Kuettlingeria erythrocarpa]